MNDLKKLTQITLLAIITLFISYESIQSMRANAWYFNALNTLKQPRALITPQELNLANDAITLATQLEPLQAHYWQLSAYIKMLRLTEKNVNRSNVPKVYKQAELALLNSLKYRQSWAETWIELAKIVSYQEGPSERVFGYVQQAKKAGPYKIDVHLGVIEIALINWHQLPPKYKALYVSELKLLAKHGYKFPLVFDIAKQTDALPILCMSLQFGNDFEKIRGSFIFEQHCKSRRVYTSSLHIK
ncbi:VpsP family polysaccharide biosynthesis protein [Pseudoalteromonas sp. R86517]|uniref:VpsP family polysaccharide biosynthesis protein n=1 Tax=Pseudoalteromonas sp. R86517 TaxID=3093857 RepID=UPI0036713BC7